MAGELLAAQRSTENNVREMVNGELSDVRRALAEIMSRLNNSTPRENGEEVLRPNASFGDIRNINQNVPIGLTIAPQNTPSAGNFSTSSEQNGTEFLIRPAATPNVDLMRIRVDKLG